MKKIGEIIKKIGLVIIAMIVISFATLSLIIANAINKDWLKLSKN